MKIRQWLLDPDGRVIRVHESHDGGAHWTMLDPASIIPGPAIYSRVGHYSVAMGGTVETLLEKVPEPGDPPGDPPVRLVPMVTDRRCTIASCNRLAVAPSHGYCAEHEALFHSLAVPSTQSNVVLNVPAAVGLISLQCRACGQPTRAAFPPRHWCDECSYYDEETSAPQSGAIWMENPPMNVRVDDDHHRIDDHQLERLRRLESMQQIEALTKAGIIPANVMEKFLQENLGKKPSPTADEPKPEKLQRRIRL